MAKKSAHQAKTGNTAARTEKAQNARQLYLIDASVYIFRAFFSMPDSLRDLQGRPVGAVYGFADFLIGLLGETRATHIGAFFDESLTTSFRNEIYPPYKANRDLPPPELERQLSLCREFSRLFGTGDYADANYEADDLIGACLKRHRTSGYRAWIVSSDKDLAQLLGPDDVLWDYARQRRLDPDGVKEHFGVPPEFIADYLALCGDAVDNIPGLPGIGKKTAALLIQKFGGLDRLLSRTEDVAASSVRGAAKIAQTLKDHADLARTFLKLTRIETRIKSNVAQIPTLRELTYRGPDLAALDEFFAREGFGARLRTRVLKLSESNTAAS